MSSGGDSWFHWIMPALLDHDVCPVSCEKTTKAKNGVQYEYMAILTYAVLQYNDREPISK